MALAKYLRSRCSAASVRRASASLKDIKQAQFWPLGLLIYNLLCCMLRTTVLFLLTWQVRPFYWRGCTSVRSFTMSTSQRKSKAAGGKKRTLEQAWGLQVACCIYVFDRFQLKVSVQQSSRYLSL
jgi:uncharacterized protein YceK